MLNPLAGIPHFGVPMHLDWPAAPRVSVMPGGQADAAELKLWACVEVCDAKRMTASPVARSKEVGCSMSSPKVCKVLILDYMEHGGDQWLQPAGRRKNGWFVLEFQEYVMEITTLG